MTMSIHAPGASEADIQRGLAAAQAVLDEAGVTPVEGMWAQAREEKWDLSGFDDEKEPTPREHMAAIALDRARQAAEEACFAGWETRPKEGNWYLEVKDVESQKLSQAYEAWRLAAEQLRYLMSGIVHGSSINIDPIYQKRAEVDALQEDWMRLAEGLLAPAGRGAPKDSGDAL